MVIQDEDKRRALYFVKDSGQNVLESAMNLKNPELLELSYSRVMFVSHLYNMHIRSALLVGLGGGSMPRFIESAFPDVKLDIVEIDPVMKKVARDFFQWSPGKNTNLFIEDIYNFLPRVKNRYDVIYMDAYLKPAESTDSLGVPLRLKSEAFYRNLREALKPDGIVAFNLNNSVHLREDIAGTCPYFSSVRLFPVPTRENRVLFAFRDQTSVTEADLRARARKLDEARFTPYSMESLIKGMQVIQM
jgi:spermidine synthase